MTAALVVAAQTLCCLGMGAVVLRLLGRLAMLSDIERIAWSFALGMGLLGWLIFFVGIAGWLHPVVLGGVLAVGLLGCWLLYPVTSGAFGAFDLCQMICIVILIVALSFDLLEGVSPPADADSLAYHFALPKQFIGAGRIEFVPRAVDGAIPLLIQMTYVPALALGGELALTLWMTVSGWGVVLLTYAVSRRFFGRAGGLMVAALLATTPAVVYSGGAGHVEVRLAMFALLAAITIADTARSGDWRDAALAGLAMGFVIGGKYSGPLIALAGGIALVVALAGQRRPWLTLASVMTMTALVAGGQWYAWNWVHTGDPVFPVLFGYVDYHDGSIWDVGHQQALAQVAAIDERGVPVNVFWWIAYPFVATLKGLPIFEFTRTGFGPFIFLILPMALLGVWLRRADIRQSPLLVFAVIAVLFYAFWFFAGFSQRIRHLLPVYPMLLIGVAAAAARYGALSGRRRAMVAAAGLSLALQIFGHFIFARNYMQYLFTSETRDAFLGRNVLGYQAVAWINTNLSQSAKVFTIERQLVYHFAVPVYYGHPVDDALIDVRSDAKDPTRFLIQLRQQGISHILLREGDPQADSGIDQWRALASAGCLQVVRTFDVAVFQSRTLPSLAQSAEKMGLFRFDGPSCDAVLARADSP